MSNAAPAILARMAAKVRWGEYAMPIVING